MGLQADKVSTAQPMADDRAYTTPPPDYSVLGTGGRWKNSDNRPPALFGAGGHWDGAPALIQTFVNRQI